MLEPAQRLFRMFKKAFEHFQMGLQALYEALWDPRFTALRIPHLGRQLRSLFWAPPANLDPWDELWLWTFAE